LSQEEDDALLAELYKKVKTSDPSVAEVIDPWELCDDPEQQVFAISTEPNIFLAPDFLSDEECDHLLDLCEEKWAPTLVMTAGANGQFENLKQKSSSLRTSHGSIIDYAATPLVADIEKRLADLAGMDLNNLERLVMVRYEEGQQYKIHHDGVWRLVTVFIYLNELPEDAEGETWFPNLEVKIKPRKGCAVMWPNTCGIGPDGQHIEDTRMMHAGLPPIPECTKYGVNCFFNVEPKRLQRDDAHGGQGPPRLSRAESGSLTPSASSFMLPRPGTGSLTPSASSFMLPRPEMLDPSHMAAFGRHERDPSHLAAFGRHERDPSHMPAFGRPPPSPYALPQMGRPLQYPPASQYPPSQYPPSQYPPSMALPQPRSSRSFPRSGSGPRQGIRCGAPAFDMRSPFQVLA
jgi:hypothetical protein